MGYVNYHKHSYYSNILVPDSPVSPEDYAKRAAELGHEALSSVEHGWQSRYIEYYENAKKYNLKFIIGAEAYVVKDRKEKDNINAHIILLAKNENGRKNLNRILSEANVSGFYYRPRVDLELLYSLPKDDVWITTACVGGLWKYEDSEKIVLDLAEYFGKNFFLEVQNHNTDSQKELNKKIIDLSNHYSIPIIFGCDSHYIYPEQAKVREDYLLSKHVVYEDEDGWYMDYPSDEEVLHRFEEQNVLTSAQIKEAIENTKSFLQVEEYNSEVFNADVKLPTLYHGKTQEEKNKILSDLIWKKWDEEKQNIPNNKWEHYISEINKELNTILETGMADYFLLDYEVVKKGIEIGGKITLTGRGSAVSYYTSKLLGLTTVDRVSSPVKLFPERFMTKERILEAKTLPDVDLNLANPEVFAKAQQIVLGEDHSYPMLAYGTAKPKAAWKLYARAKEIDFETANRVSEQIDQYEMAVKHTEDESEKENIDVLEFIEDQYKQLYEESNIYLGLISDAKIHPCAYLLYNNSIKEEIGLIKIKDNLCCLMDGLWAEQYHFLKNDLLKVASVDLIYKVYERLGKKPEQLNELVKLCENNKRVWDVYKNAWTMGINQMEQTSTSGRVAKYSPKNISEISAFVAAIRPGFKSNYHQFESREPFSYGVKTLDSLIQTEEFPQSYMLYQENAMQVLAYAGIEISKTYEIVKNIAKKRVEKVLKYKMQFLEGMTKRLIEEEGQSQELADEIATMTWKIIEDSSHYSFNSSHSYSMAGDSLYGAYLKSTYPLEFYEVFLDLLEKDGDKDRLSKAKEEARKAYKIKFPPYRFGQDNRKIVADKENNEIVSSLSSIKGFGQTISDNVFELTKEHFDNFVDLLIFAEEKGLLSSKFEQLIKINYFEQFGKNKKLYEIFQEFQTGKSRYNRKLTEKSKTKRTAELKEIFNKLPNENFPIYDQLNFENEILGYIQTVYPISGRYVFVYEVDQKYSPRIDAYCFATGKVGSIKIQKSVFAKKPFEAGNILYINTFEEKPSVKFVDGKWVENENEKTIWASIYNVISPEDFNKLINKNS